MFQGEIYGNITTDVINIVNMFINITASSTENDILAYVADALEILASKTKSICVRPMLVTNKP